jgi:hypothetical protein
MSQLSSATKQSHIKKNLCFSYGSSSDRLYCMCLLSQWSTACFTKLAPPPLHLLLNTVTNSSTAVCICCILNQSLQVVLIFSSCIWMKICSFLILYYLRLIWSLLGFLWIGFGQECLSFREAKACFMLVVELSTLMTDLVTSSRIFPVSFQNNTLLQCKEITISYTFSGTSFYFGTLFTLW